VKRLLIQKKFTIGRSMETSLQVIEKDALRKKAEKKYPK
jgi:hypothetical protein